VTRVAGSQIQTLSGRRVDPFAPDRGQIDFDDIAQALSNQCRFGGHCRVFYSVAQHSCLATDLVAARGGDATDQLWALLHDAPAAYRVDLPHPLKHRSELGHLYRQAEVLLQEAICQRFDLPAEPPPSLKPIDRTLLATERRALSKTAWDWPELEGIGPLDLEIEPWLPPRAADEFRARYTPGTGLGGLPRRIRPPRRRARCRASGSAHGRFRTATSRRRSRCGSPRRIAWRTHAPPSGRARRRPSRSPRPDSSRT
jgi:hypothetical protein